MDEEKKRDELDAEDALEDARQDYLDMLEEDKQNKLDEIEDAKEDRKYWFEYYCETINEIREHYDCKRVSKKLFKQVVAEFEAGGIIQEEIEKHEEEFFDKVFHINPEMYKPTKKTSADNLGCLVIFIIFVCAITAFSCV